MTSCIFCKIVKGEIPSAKLYEDDSTMSFLDINPINPGHALVIPKNHYPTILDVDEEDLKKTIIATKIVAKALKDALSCDGINILQNNFEAAGQLIYHFHIHVIPRFEGDGLKVWSGVPYKEGAMEDIHGKILSAMRK
ncbi:MAG: HIT family protein [Syntrophobacterales bacterium]|nr:HIT family protein [Syntrophobacterales bacterium]